MMNQFFTILLSKHLRKVVSSPTYNAERLDEMHRKIQYWRNSKAEANTVAGRDYCNLMMNCYLARYKYYLTRK